MILFRDATDDERFDVVRAQWLNRVRPRSDGKDAGPHGVAFGRRETGVSHDIATRMAELVVDDLLSRVDVVVTVAELQSDAVGPEIVGWSAHEPGKAVHFVCVPSGYGRSDIGTNLLRRAGANLPASWSTPNGRALLQAVRGKVKAA